MRFIMLYVFECLHIGDSDFCIGYYGNRQAYFENSFFFKASYVLMCVKGFYVVLGIKIVCFRKYVSICN